MRHKERGTLGVRSTSPSGESRVKRASYYVWFLGAEECRGLRGSEVVRPVVQYFIERERDHEPEKITLQVSSRGVKLLQPGITSRAAAAGSTKHFIPASALTYVQQENSPDNDIVSAVLLIYNPLTRCPVHVHSYRCDSTETAALLRDHLLQLLQKPDQQAKLLALESRLTAKGLLPSCHSSDGTSSGSSTSSGAGSGPGRSPPHGEKITSLYDSLAAELREKLGGGGGGSLLFPSRDYNCKPSRIKNRSSGLDPGVMVTRKNNEDDSARSSGIGSDDTPSPTQDTNFTPLEHQSSSDEEWAGHQSAEVHGEAALLLVQPPWRGRQLPITRRGRSPSPRQLYPQNDKGSRDTPPKRPKSPLRIISQKLHKRSSPNHHERSESPISPKERFQDARDMFLSLERQKSAQDLNSRSSPNGLGRTTSWEAGPRSPKHHQNYRLVGDSRRTRDIPRQAARNKYGSREDILWPKSEKDTGYGSRDMLLREKLGRDWNRNYGTSDAGEFDPWKADAGRRTPDPWDTRLPSQSFSPVRTRTRSPSRDHRVPRVRSPDRHEYHRAKSMHDLSHRRSLAEDDCRIDSRRHSLYDPPGEIFGRDVRKPMYSSHANLQRPVSSCSSSSSSRSNRYLELPESQRYPGLDKATARPDPLDVRSPPNKRTFDYPVNGGHAPIHITRAQHDDYRKFRYDHSNIPFMRPPPLSAVQF